MLTSFCATLVGVERSFAIRLSQAFAVIRTPDKAGDSQEGMDEHDGSAPGSAVELTAALFMATEMRDSQPP